jgi:ABC-type transport system involved in multi-copper enzyme maturation permease subunit
MTPATTPYRSRRRPGQAGFAQLLHAEWTKFRTVRGWVIGMMVAALVTVLLGVLTAAGSHCSVGPFPGQPAEACTEPVGPGGEAVSDSFYFVRQPLAGNGSITVRLTALAGRYATHLSQPGQDPTAGMHPGLQPWAKAGIIIKESTRPGSAYAAVMVTGSHGVRMQSDYTHDSAGLAGTGSAAHPRWLRLTRVGDTLTGYDSADGTHWAEVGAARLAGLHATVQAGLFAAAPAHQQVASQSLGGSSDTGGPSQVTGVFDHLSLHGGLASGRWSGGQVGSSASDQASSLGGFHQADGRFTVAGSGDIAPAMAGGAGVGGEIEQSLVGAFGGLIAVIVVGTMFITAEYRRGLIRTTLAASPHRGRVLAAKAIVLGLVTFVAGLAGSVVAVPLGERILRANGNFVLPVTWLTEFRVVAGTAALLAVAAVLALAVGTMLRRSVGAVTAVIAAVVLPYLLATANFLPAGPSEWLLRVTPAAGFAIQQSIPQYPQVSNAYTPFNGYYPLAPWAGFAVLCAWAALVLGLAVYLLRRRDA